MAIRWVLGVGAFWLVMPLFVLWGPLPLLAYVLVFAAWAALGAFLDAERWRVRIWALSRRSGTRERSEPPSPLRRRIPYT